MHSSYELRWNVNEKSEEHFAGEQGSYLGPQKEQCKDVPICVSWKNIEEAFSVYLEVGGLT
jgi:hypothetical protein